MMSHQLTPNKTRTCTSIAERITCDWLMMFPVKGLKEKIGINHRRFQINRCVGVKKSHGFKTVKARHMRLKPHFTALMLAPHD